MDENIRLNLEKAIDELLSQPMIIEERARTYLIEMGIEPSLETVLSYICGGLMGLVTASSTGRHGSIRDQNIEGAITLLKRRAWELRRAFINTRVE